MNAHQDASIYHVLLIGIDRYPRNKSLSGCVNDIDAIEQLLLIPPGVGIPSKQIRVTRLAAPRPDLSYSWHSKIETLLPTKSNLLQSLKTLAGPQVRPSDRVLIYYSGHGAEQRWTGSSVWHEAIVAHNDDDFEYLFDAEMNGLIQAIAERTSDLTIVLDSCHSAGATRGLNDIQPGGQMRALQGDDRPVNPPDLADVRAVSRTGMLQSPDPNYLVLVACQADERASEGSYPGDQPAHGVFTRSLLRVLSEKDAAQRAQLRWADIWPELLARVAEYSAQLKRPSQHPWMIGRGERRVFGGQWEKMDAGYQVTIQPDGCYAVGAGSLMNVTEGAEIAVYGAQPLHFAAIDSPEDKPTGRLVVVESGPSTSAARPAGAPFELPEGARGRLVRPGSSRRLRVSLKPEDIKTIEQLQASPLLAIVSPEDPNADVEVIAQPGGGWIIGSDTERLLAAIPTGEIRALRAGLEHYYRFNTVLSMARNCSDPQWSNSLNVHILDCNGASSLESMSPEALADPPFPEAPRDADRIYFLKRGFQFCFRVVNNYDLPLNVTLFDCTSGGYVQYLNDEVIRAKSTQVMWRNINPATPFEANPDPMPAGVPGITVPDFVTDRMIAIGTTRRDVDLRSLWVDKTVQMVVEENLFRRGSAERGALPNPPAAPAELWTAKVTPVRITRQ